MMATVTMRYATCFFASTAWPSMLGDYYPHSGSWQAEREQSVAYERTRSSGKPAVRLRAIQKPTAERLDPDEIDLDVETQVKSSAALVRQPAPAR